MFADPGRHLPKHLAESVGKTLRNKWTRLPEERRKLIKLVSRFELTRDQAARLYVQEERTKAGIESSDGDILANPYLLYELTRLTADPISMADHAKRLGPRWRLKPPFVEHFSQVFVQFFMRVGLPSAIPEFRKEPAHRRAGASPSPDVTP